MYIPSSFFSAQGACIKATTTYITGSGVVTSGSFVSASISWSYVQFAMSDTTQAGLTAFTASLNILSGSTSQAKILIVGGGGTSGQREVSFTPAGSSITYQTEYCGGGGGGGVVYYNNFPLSSGSYEIGVGPAINGTQGASGSNGNNSYIKLTNNFVYTPFTTNYLIAEGGGAGGTIGSYHQNSPSRDFYYTLGPYSGGSGGGMGNAVDTTSGGSGGTANPNGGLNSQPQGYRGGDNNVGTGAGNSCTGGGGAGSQGEDTITGVRQFTYGGDGALYNLTGTPTYYAPGGPGAGIAYKSGTFGRGGRAAASIGATADTGYGGVVIIAWPKCIYDDYTIYKMQNCCDSGSFYNIAVQNGVPWGLGYTIYNPVVGACMKSIEELSVIQNITFSLTTANSDTYNYGTDNYGGDVQCLNCRQANGLSGCLPIGGTCTIWSFRYTANLPTPPSSVSYVNCDTGTTSSFTLSVLQRNGGACVRTGTTPTWGGSIVATQTTTYCGIYPWP